MSQLHLLYAHTKLNASFVPSSLKLLRINTLTSQQFLTDSNVSHLHLFRSETSLEFIPINVRVLRIIDSELNVTCVHLQQSKIKYLSVTDNKRSLDLKCLPNVTHLVIYNTPQYHLSFSFLPESIAHLDLESNGLTQLTGFDRLASLHNLSKIIISKNKLKSFDLSYLPRNLSCLHLSDNKIENINLKQLISHPNITRFGMGANTFNCTCDTCRDFYQIAKKQLTDMLFMDCSPASLITSVELRYLTADYDSSIGQTMLQTLLEQIDNTICYMEQKQPGETIKQTEATKKQRK